MGLKGRRLEIKVGVAKGEEARDKRVWLIGTVRSE